MDNYYSDKTIIKQVRVVLANGQAFEFDSANLYKPNDDSPRRNNGLTIAAASLIIESMTNGAHGNHAIVMIQDYPQA